MRRSCGSRRVGLKRPRQATGRSCPSQSASAGAVIKGFGCYLSERVKVLREVACLAGRTFEPSLGNYKRPLRAATSRDVERPRTITSTWDYSKGGVIKTTIFVRTLEVAAELLGGDRALARYLSVPMADLFAWMRPGAGPPPLPVFLKAVDLVMNELDDKEGELAQRVRVAAIRRDSRRSF